MTRATDNRTRTCYLCTYYRAHPIRLLKENGGPDPQSERGLCKIQNKGVRHWNRCRDHEPIKSKEQRHG